MNLPFSELFLILLVALLVVKPERLPQVALTLGRWARRIRQALAQFKQDIEYHDGK